jgi:hypothetical protein
LIIEVGIRGRADIHFRENALNCQDAKSLLGDANSRDKPPGGGL